MVMSVFISITLLEQKIRLSVPITDKKTGLFSPVMHGGAEETRTLYLIAASDALSQVSYDPVL